MISPEAVQSALDAWNDIPNNECDTPEYSMQAALAAAFPIMLREVAETFAKRFGKNNDFYQEAVEIADSFSGEGG